MRAYLLVYIGACVTAACYGWLPFLWTLQAVFITESILLVGRLVREHRRPRRDGRSTVTLAAMCGVAAFFVSLLIAPARGGTITPRAGETYDAFIARAVQEIVNART